VRPEVTDTVSEGGEEQIRNWVTLGDAVLGCKMSDDQQRTLEAVREIVQQKFATPEKAA
jgi:hypothetical protein